MKICTGCKLEKPLSAFRQKIATKPALRPKCRECLSKECIAYHKANSEETKRRNRQCYERRKHSLDRRYAHMQATFGDRVKLSLEEYKSIFQINPPCVYCGQEFRSSGSGLDRMDNSKDYELSNVVPCCGICNVIKGQYLTFDEMKVAMTAILKFRKSRET